MTNPGTHRETSHPLLHVALALLVLTLPALASAHIENQQTQFPDIGTSSHKDAIVLLVALDIVPQTPTFEPDQPFTRQDLAAWAALAHRKDAGSETPDMAKLIQDGTSYVGSTTGNATAADINHAIFDGKLQLDQVSQTFTHDQAAAFIAAHLTPSFIAGLGAQPGPSGTVTKVTTGTAPDGDTSYSLDIGKTSYAVYDHARVVGPTDLTLWQDKTVASSYLEKTSDGDQLVYLAMAQPASASTSAQTTARPAAPKRSATSSPALRWIIGLAVVLLALALVAFFRPRRRAP